MGTNYRYWSSTVKWVGKTCGANPTWVLTLVSSPQLNEQIYQCKQRMQGGDVSYSCGNIS